MDVDSKYGVRIHIFMIHLLISGAQYIISSLNINKLTHHGIPKIVRISSKLIPTLHTFDMCIYQSSSCCTIQYIVDK